MYIQTTKFYNLLTFYNKLKKDIYYKDNRNKIRSACLMKYIAFRYFICAKSIEICNPIPYSNLIQAVCLTCLIISIKFFGSLTRAGIENVQTKDWKSHYKNLKLN